jgi:hypothetical protein
MTRVFARVALVLTLILPALANSKLDLIAIRSDGTYQQLKGHPTLEATTISYFADGVYRPILMLGFQSFFTYAGPVSFAFTFANTLIPGSGQCWLYPGAYGFGGFVLPDVYGAHRASFTVVFGNGIHKRANFLLNNQPVAVPEPEMWVMLVVCIPVLLLLARVMVRD